jgi:hypothetical protein
MPITPSQTLDIPLNPSQKHIPCAGRRLFEVLALMSQQCQATARLLHWAWGANDRLARRLTRLLARDEPFVRIDRVCRRLEQTQVCTTYTCVWWGVVFECLGAGLS